MFGDRTVGVFVGVDVAKERHWAQALSPDGEGLFEGSVANDQAAVEALLDRAEAAGGGWGVVLVVDMVSSAALLLLAVAAERGTPVAYVSGLRMRRAAQLYEGEAKTDPKDAWVLADYARRNVDRLTWVETTDRSLARMRVLCGHDEDLACDQTRQVNRLREAVLSVCPALERVLGPRLTCLGVLDVLGKYPSPALMRRAGRARLRNLIHKRSPKLSTKASQQIRGPQNPNRNPPRHRHLGRNDPPPNPPTRTNHHPPQGNPSRPRRGAQNKPSRRSPGHDPRLRTQDHPQSPNRNRRPPPLRQRSQTQPPCAGLAPTDRRSGRTLNTTTHNRGGNHRLKNAMHQAAFVAIQHDPHAKRYYQTKRQQGKTHRTALTAVARRRCNIILTILKTQTPYNPKPI